MNHIADDIWLKALSIRDRIACERCGGSNLSVNMVAVALSAERMRTAGKCLDIFVSTLSATSIEDDTKHAAISAVKAALEKIMER